MLSIIFENNSNFSILGRLELMVMLTWFNNIIYSIYRALIPNGPKALYIIKNNNKILNLQNYKTTLSSYKNIIILYNIIVNFKKPSLELRFKGRKGITRSKFEFPLLQTKVLKVLISSTFLFSHLILYFMQWTSGRKLFDLDKKRFFYEFLKPWKSNFLAVYPSHWSHDRHAQSCDVDSGMYEFRLDLSRLFYLCKFCFVVLAKCSFAAFCMNY